MQKMGFLKCGHAPNNRCLCVAIRALKSFVEAGASSKSERQYTGQDLTFKDYDLAVKTRLVINRFLVKDCCNKGFSNATPSSHCL